MRLKVCLPIAGVVFMAATMGSDVVALTTIGGESIEIALREHFYWAGVEVVGTLLLLVPFLAVALISAFSERKAGKPATALIFAVAMLALLYFYFQGYQAAELAALEKRWTAATLSIGLLPFFKGVPIAVAAAVAQAVAARFNRRTSG